MITEIRLHNAAIIFHYFPELSGNQKAQFNSLYDLYKEWNEKINVISRKDIGNLYTHHVLHSLGIAKVISFKPGARILDVGTGGGFPGIPLALMFPQVQFDLIDSIGKKITVVNAVAQALELKNVKAMQTRAEQVTGRYDFVVSRAVTRLSEFYGWVHGKIKQQSVHELENGILYLKGGNLEDELAELKRPYSVYQLHDFFSEEFFETKKVVHIPMK
ncbi:MAG: 16S rRNA (guanine(527)-N(7))-methyltransferase RsmG [Cyclobacteriaceae bacterium]|nr:16S rRNA (guanine(527)-N(7))-methyltransferase RsmG [Cyclobacteriaceae bacterium]